MSGILYFVSRFRFLVLITAGIVVFLGATRMNTNSLDLLPEFTPPIVEVQTEALGLSAEEVESLITVPMEADLLNGISWIETIRSQSLPGLSSIVMTFEEGTDVWKARQLVQEKLTQAHALPNVSRPPVMLQPLSSASRVMQIGLSSSTLSNIDISVEAHWNIRPRLMGVAGVANVSIWGLRNRQIQVLVDPVKLHDNQISLKQVLSTTGNALWFSPLSYLDASAPGSGGFIDTPNQRLSIRHVLPISTPEEFANVSIEGSKLTLGDVTTIVEDHQPLIGDALVGDGQGLMLVIEKFPWADSLAVTRGVDSAIEDLRPSLPGVDINTQTFRRANFIEASFGNIITVSLIGLVLLLGAIAVTQRNLKSVIVAAITIPVSLASALTLLFYLPYKPDITMLAGLIAAIGLVVNDATAGARTIAKEQGNGRSIVSVIDESFRMARGSVIIATLIALAACLPLFAISGVSGAVTSSVAMAFLGMVVISIIVSATVAPAIWTILDALGYKNSKLNISAVPDLPTYSDTLKENNPLVLGAALVLAVLAIGITAISQRSLVPSFNERIVLIDWTGVPGASHPETVRVASKLLEEVRALPRVEGAGAHIGRAITSDSTSNVNAAQFWVTLKPDSDRSEAISVISAIVDSYPGSDRNILNYSEASTQDFRLPRDIDELTVRVFGYELDLLDDLANEVRTALDGVAGDRPVIVQEQTLVPVLKIEADLEKSKLSGIKPGDIRRTAAILLSGLEVGSLFEDQKVFEVVLWGAPEIRQNVTAVADILIDTPSGGIVRLGDVANVSIGSLPNVIRRDAVSRYRDVIVDVSGANVGPIAASIEQRLAELKFPLEYHAELLPDYVIASNALSRLLFAAAVAAAGIFLLTQAAVGGWALGAAVFVSILAAASGAAIVMAMTGNQLTTGALAGLVGTLAFAARTSLNQINRYQLMERQGVPFGDDLVSSGTRDHFASMSTAALGTIAVLIPAAVMGSQRPGLEILGPLASVMIGGVITAVLVNYYLLPTLYLRFGAETARTEAELFVGKEEIHVS